MMVLPLILMAVAAWQPDQRLGQAFLSPMGEPFFGRTPGEDGLVVWFDQADRNHDGVLTVDEMTADADRFFQILDLNHDGEIDPDEIAHYERVIAPEVRRGPLPSPQASAQGPAGGQQRGGGRHGGGRGRGGGGGFRGGGDSGFGGASDEAASGRYGLLEIPEPVASADADFNRGVSAMEFRNAAIARFQLLDINHTGRLTLPELQEIRRAALSDSRRPPPAPKDQDESPEND